MAEPFRIRVPIWKVTKESYLSVFAHPITFAKLAWLPGLVIWAVLAPLFVLFFQSADAMAPSLREQPQQFLESMRWFEVPSVLAGAAALLALNVFAVRWHRYRLRGEVVIGLSNMFGKAWQRFTLYALLIWSPAIATELLKIVALFAPGTISAISDPVADILGAVLWLAWVALAVYVFGASLVFPAAAYEQPMSWRQAWRLLQGNFWRLAGCCALTGLFWLLTSLFIFVFLDIGLSLVVPLSPVGTVSTLQQVATLTLLELILAALYASILCEFYHRIVLEAEVVQSLG